MFENILKESFPDAAEILSHTSYRNTFVREISIREHRQRLLGDNDRSPTQEAPSLNHLTNGYNNNIAASVPVPNPCTGGPCAQRHVPESIPQTSQAAQPTQKPKRNELTEFLDDIRPNLQINVKRSNRIHGDPTSKIGTYTMNSPNRGIFVLVNNIHFKNKNRRNGAEADRDNLVALFRQMGFTILLYEDLSKDVSIFPIQ